VDDLINRSRAEADPARRLKLFEQIAPAIAKERPIIYLFHRHWLWAYNTKLGGVRAVPDGLMRLQDLKFN
jgi:peptide/nickel transport system substrate-binding protein